MSVVIGSVEPDSLAEKAGLAPGDILCTMDGHPVEDVLDYRFYMVNTKVTLEGTTAEGEPWAKTIRKGQYDDLGLEFDSYLMDEQRLCKNKCVFCFIDQMPPGLRDSLYCKDDDSRMSFLFGNYITLTNLREQDVQRILDMHISPVNISVHTTSPQLRVKMMKNPSAGEVLRYLPRLAAGGIKINAQLVLCPGINDGEELERSLRDLCAYAPGLQSLAVVPVGLTRYREGLPELRLFSQPEAQAVIAAVNRYGDDMLAHHGQRICFAADEFYLAAEEPVPAGDFYEDYAQLENGVGLLALLQQEFRDALALEPVPEEAISRRITLATGTAAYPYLLAMAQAAEAQFPGLSIQVVEITNHFFGATITVAGLVTGSDLSAQLGDKSLGEELLLPAVMLRHEGDLFLDSLSLDELSRTLHVPIRTVPNDGFALLDALLGNPAL